METHLPKSSVVEHDSLSRLLYPIPPYQGKETKLLGGVAHLRSQGHEQVRAKGSQDG